LRALLSPYESEGDQQRRFVILGDDPPIGPHATTSVALSIHELATNTVKYGALSSPAGRVTITTRINAEGECDLGWTERGGPTVLGHPDRTGFGSKLLLRSITGALSGRVTRKWDREGLTLLLTLPLMPLSQ
jgi:two-component sensor histidine kinase